MTLAAALTVLGLVLGELYIFGSAWETLASPTCARGWKRWLKARAVRQGWYTVWAPIFLDPRSALMMVGFSLGLSLIDGARRWLVTRVTERHRLRTEVLALAVAVLATVAFVHESALRLTPAASVWGQAFSSAIFPGLPDDDKIRAALVLILSGYLFAMPGGTDIVRGVLRHTTQSEGIKTAPRIAEYPRPWAVEASSTGSMPSGPAMLEVAAAAPQAPSGTSSPHTAEVPHSQTDLGHALKMGRVIGNLERLFYITALLAGRPEAIALVLGVKSLARFDQLKDRGFAEYYLVGTLTSLALALLVGVVLQQVLRTAFG